MNLPNKLTLTRIILVPVFMIFVSLTGLDGIVDGTFNAAFYLLAGIVFAAASFTDFLDGHLARKWHMVTDFGKFADPLADKLLTTVAFIYMLRDGVCSPVVLCIILAREFAVSGLRMVAAGAKDGKVIAANMWGKVKTVLQMLSIIFYFFGTALSYRGTVESVSIVVVISIALCWLVAAVTPISGIKYLWDNRSFINTAIERRVQHYNETAPAGSFQLSFSTGVAKYEGGSVEKFLVELDQRMYAEKRAFHAARDGHAAPEQGNAPSI